MAISGKFTADFSDFLSAVTAAETKLVSFETGSTKVQASLERMEKSLSGQRLIQDATLAAEAVERIGGVSMLTEEELQRLGAQAEEAMEKMIRMGVDVPPGIKAIADASREAATETGRLGEAAGGASPKTAGLSTSLRAVDGSLRAMGVNVGPVVNVIEEIGAASGKSAGALGVLGTAGAVLAAGIGGWKIGRAISEFFDLDKKIGDATAKLLGWGDVAKEEAAAGAETLARASANAGRKITDMTEAVKINEAAVVAMQKVVPPAAVDLGKMRDELLKTEEAFYKQRDSAIATAPAIKSVGEAAIEATRNLSALEAKLNAVDRLNSSINSRLQALNDDLDRQQRERDARRTGDTAISVTRNIEGRVTPLSERDAANTQALQMMIAKLERAIAEFVLPKFDAGAGPRASDLVLAAAQQNADNLKQLEYLRTLLAAAPPAPTIPTLSPSAINASAFGGRSLTINNNTTISGVLDPSAKRQLVAIIDEQVMTTLKMSRQLGTA